MSEPNAKKSKTTQYLLEGTAVIVLTILVAVVGTLHFTRPPIRYTSQVDALEKTVLARVMEINKEEISVDAEGLTWAAQELNVKVLSKGEHKGETITITYNGMGPTAEVVSFKKGELAMVMISKRPDQQTFYQIADHVRLWPIALVTLIFSVMTVAIGRWQGLRALLGLLLSALLIGGFILPQILAHRDPTLVSIAGTALLLALTLYLIQGWNSTCHAALLGMMLSLVFTGALTLIWTQVARLTGFGSEETLYLQATGVSINPRGLLMAGMIIGAAGVLDDVILAQAITVFEIVELEAGSTLRSLYRRAMKIGVAHLASMVNTLALAYLSSALPLVILFYLYPEPWYLTLNRELISEEIIRTLVGMTGLLGAVPLTTFIAAWVATATKPPATPET